MYYSGSTTASNLSFSFELPSFYPHCVFNQILFCQLVLFQLSGDLALTHDDHSVAHTDYFVHFRRDHNHCDTLFCKLINNTIYFCLCTYVNAPGRLIKNDAFTICRNPFCQCNLLLVSTT